MAEEITEKTQSAKLHDDFWVPFQHRADLIATIEEDERFYRGDQWDGDNPTNAPRIVLNRIQDAIRKLASKICGTPLHLAFVSSGNDVDCTALQRYDEFVMAKLGYKAFSFQSAINGENLGTEIVYWYFDGDAPYDIGGFYKGGVMCKHISPKQFAVSNPYEPDIQKQDWVMTWTEQYIRSLEAIIEGDRALSKAEKKKRIEALYQEGRKQYSDSTHADLYLINNTLVRVYMRFFRIKGEVCYTLETENVTLTKYPIPLSKAVSETYAKAVAKAFADDKNLEYDPKTKEAQLIKDLDFDFPDSIAKGYPERREEDGFERYQERFSLYPFCVWKPKEINDFFFGMSITKLMVPIQQAINYGATLQIRHMQNMAQPKVLAKEDALGGDVWSNDPADNLQIDHTRGDGFGFKTLDVPDMPNDAFKVPDWLTEQMKDTYGFGEILSGTVNGNDMSGYLYSLALKQANSTLEQEQQLFWKFQVDNARIRLMFYKHYVDKRYYTYELDAPEYEKEEQARQALLRGVNNGLTVTAPDGTPYSKEDIQRRFGKPTSKTQVKSFDGRDLWGLDFDIKIVAQQGLVESQLNGINKCSGTGKSSNTRRTPTSSPSWPKRLRSVWFPRNTARP